MQAILSLGPDTVVCGHSYGGRVMSAAAARVTSLGHMVYLAAAMPDAKQLESYRQAERLHTSDPPGFSTAWQLFYSACSRAAALQAFAQLRPMESVPGGITGLENQPWTRFPSTYVICENDQSLGSDVQRQMARNARYSVSLATDHSPFFSAPRPLADVLCRISRYDSPGAASPVHPAQPSDATGPVP